LNPPTKGPACRQAGCGTLFFPIEEAKQGCSGISYVLEAALQVAERFLFPPKAKIRLIRVFSFKYLATPQAWCRAKLSISGIQYLPPKQ